MGENLLLKKNVFRHDRCGEVGVHPLKTVEHYPQLLVLIFHNHLKRPKYLPSTGLEMLCLLELL